MKFKGTKLWVALCACVVYVGVMPLMCMCFIGLFPALLVVNKRETGAFSVVSLFEGILGMARGYY